MSDTRLVVLYDGVCGLCDKTIQVLLEADRRGVLKFAPLQGTTAAEIFHRHPAETNPVLSQERKEPSGGAEGAEGPALSPSTEPVLSPSTPLGINSAEPFRSIIFVEDYNTPTETLFLRSEGVLRICGKLGGLWRILSWFRIVPLFIRDGVYNWISRNRYGWFGKYNECRLPKPEWQARFLP